MLIGHQLHHLQSSVTAAGTTAQTQSIASQAVGDSVRTLDQHRLREVTFIGVGSSVAYLLNELNSRFESRDQLAGDVAATPFQGKVSIIGKEDPWTGNVRGKGDINHQTEIIGQWGQYAPAYDPGYADRGTFAASNQQQLDRAVALGAERVEALVADIKQLDDGCFRISLDNGHVLDSKQVVLGAGAGPHTSIWKGNEPQTNAEKRLDNIRLHNQEALRGKVMDLDEFMRASDASPTQFNGKTVVVHGPNAGIDAVERAGDQGATVIWFTRSTSPVLLDGNQLKHAPSVAKNALYSVNNLDIQPSQEGAGLQLSYTAPGKDIQERLEADYYVYALGQDIHKPGSAGAMLGGLLNQLEPIYDYDQIYSDQPFKTVLGLQSSGANSSGGLIVVGASVAQLAVNVQHTYVNDAMDRILNQLDKMSGEKAAILSQMLLQPETTTEQIQAHMQTWHVDEAQKSTKQVLQNQVQDYLAARDYFLQRKGGPGVAAEVENQTVTEVASVIVSPQLGTVKASAAALSGLMPAYVANRENNFTTDNRTMLRAGIADRYPNIGNAEAGAFIEDVTNLRHLSSQDFIKQATGNASQSANSPTPVHGVPESTRAAYEARLAALNAGARDNVPLSQLWLSSK